MKLKLIFFLVLMLMGAVSFFGFRWLVGDHGQVASGEVLAVQGECRLDQAPCEATGIAQRRVAVSLSPAPLPLMKPVTTNVTLQGFEDVLAVHFHVEGVNMFMGYQQAVLKTAEATEQPADASQNRALSTTQLAGDFMLPICSNEVMHWKGTLSIQTRARLFQAHFPFTTTTALSPSND